MSIWIHALCTKSLGPLTAAGLRDATRHGAIMAGALEAFNTEWTLFDGQIRLRLVNPFIEAGFKAMWNRLMRDASELERQLPAGARVVPSRSADVLTYAFTWNGRTRPALELLQEGGDEEGDE